MKNLENSVTRRNFLKIGLLGSAGASLLAPAVTSTAGPLGAVEPAFCVTLGNHWSYIGIGWNLGLESCVLSIIDSLGLSDLPPSVKTCINFDARAFELIAEKFPEIADKLKRYLDAGKVELVGGSYAQPLGTSVSGESNIRQIVLGREVVQKALGYELVTFLEEEEFSHPQLPQILMGAGFQYASLAQVDTWGRAGIPLLDVNAFQWKGKDGTTIPTSAKNSLFAYSPDLKALKSLPGLTKLQALGMPLVVNWEEFGWEPHEQPAYVDRAEKYKKLSEVLPVEFVSLKEYMQKYGGQAKEKIYLNMDSWKKLLTWGLGGDQVRILDRKIEGLLLAAERFDAVAHFRGAQTQERSLEQAWRDLLTAQSHDVSLCEYSRWWGPMAALDRMEDKHNVAWGVIGYNHMDAAQKLGQAVLSSSLNYISSQIDSEDTKQGALAVTVFNPSGWERTDVVTTGRIHFKEQRGKNLVVKDKVGRVLVSQLIGSEAIPAKDQRDSQGNLMVANVAFFAEKIPAIGYDTYYLEFQSGQMESPSSDLRIDEKRLELENDYVKIRIDSTTGSVISLVNKRTGRETLDGKKGPFPLFRGRANPEFPVRGAEMKQQLPRQDTVGKMEFDSSQSKASVRWVEKGPFRATVKARHEWPLLKFETYVSLHAHQPWVEVTSRILSDVPPAIDVLGPDGRFPAEIKEGYWLSFAPHFEPISIIRDFPLAVEPTTERFFQGLTFVDLMGREDGLLLLHAGTQYFNRDSNGVFSNLVMREWESHFSNEYGWPRYAEYRHALMPHGVHFTNAERMRASTDFTQLLLAIVGEPQTGSLPKRKGFVSVEPESIQVSAFRKKEGRGFELRLVEVDGEEAMASVNLALPMGEVLETNLLGSKLGDLSPHANEFRFKAQPWKIQTFEIV
jgi:alpha-mannosidase